MYGPRVTQSRADNGHGSARYESNRGIAGIGGRISSAAHGPWGLIYTPLRPDTQCCYSRAAIKKEKKLAVTSEDAPFYCCHPVSIY